MAKKIAGVMLLVLTALTGCDTIPKRSVVDVEASHLCSYLKVRVEVER